LPWWFNGVLGGVLTYWLGPKLLAGQWGLPEAPHGLQVGEVDVSTLEAWIVAGIYFTPGALLGGLFGWFFIRPVNRALGGVFQAFNRCFDLATAVYGRMIAGLLRVSLVMLAVYGGLLYLTYWSFMSTPTGFIPQQDKGYLLVNVQLPDAASVTR